MKNSPLTTMLLAALAISAVASVVLCWAYISNARELRNLQIQTSAINNRYSGMNSLIGELLEYSKKDPSIDPLLDTVVQRPKSTASNTNKPATK